MITREDCFKVGEVAKTHNLQGEVVITTDSDLLEKYADEPVFLLLDGAPVPFFIADEGLTVRNHTSYIVKFDYVDTLAQAGRLVGCEVLFEKELLEGQEPEESGYDILDSFDHFIIGCQNPLVHFSPVSSEFFNLIFHYPKNLIISFTLARINKPKIKIMPVI